jgi:hypothetical protein
MARTLWHLAHSSKEVSESSAPSSRSPRSVLSLVRYDSDRACISFIYLTFTYSLTPPLLRTRVRVPHNLSIW